MKRPLSRREKSIFILCVFVLLVYGVYRLGYQAMGHSNTRRQQRILQIHKELRQHRLVVREAGAIQHTLQTYRQAFAQKFSDEQEQTRMLAAVESAAQDVGINITNMEPDRVRKGDFYNLFSVNIQTQGSLAKIFEFLYALETQEHRLRILEMRLEKHSIRSEELRCQLVVSRFLVK